MIAMKNLLFLTIWLAMPLIGLSEDVWVTSIATSVIDVDGAKKQICYAGTASGLLLRPADVVRWESDDFAKRTPLMTHPCAVWCVRASDDGSHVASSDYRGNLQVMDTSSGEAKMYEAAFERWTQALRFVPGTDTIVAGNEGGKLFVFEGDKVTKSIDVEKNSITDIAFNTAADQLAISAGGGTVHLYSWPELEAKGKIKISDSPAWCVAFGHDAKVIFVGSGDRKLYRVDATDGATATEVFEGSDWITRIAISETATLAATEVGGRVYVVNSLTESLPAIKPIGVAPSGVWAVDWSSPTSLLVGTRKHGVVGVTQAWAMVPPDAPPAEAAGDDQH